MTTNIDSAAEVIGRYVHPDFAEDAAQALATEGLLLPDLPEPVWRPHAEYEFRYRVWPIPFGQVERTPRPGSLIAITDGEEDITTYTSAQAIEVAAALLSAAAYD